MLKSVRAKRGAFHSQQKGGCMIHSKIKTLACGALLVGSISLSWAQPGDEAILTKSAKEIQETKKTQAERDKQFLIDNQEIFGEGNFSPWMWQTNMDEEELAIDLDRDFSEYLVATVDREKIEQVNSEN